MWRKSVTSAPSPLPEVERAGMLRGELERKKTRAKKKPMTYTGYHTAQKRRARRGDRPLEKAVVATKSWVSPEQRQMRKNGEKRRKKTKEQTNETGALLHSRPPARDVKGKVMFATGWPRSARQYRRARLPLLRLLLQLPPRRRSSCAFGLCQRSARRRCRHHRRQKILREDLLFLSSDSDAAALHG